MLRHASPRNKWTSSRRLRAAGSPLRGARVHPSLPRDVTPMGRRPRPRWGRCTGVRFWRLLGALHWRSLLGALQLRSLLGAAGGAASPGAEGALHRMPSLHQRRPTAARRPLPVLGRAPGSTPPPSLGLYQLSLAASAVAASAPLSSGPMPLGAQPPLWDRASWPAHAQAVLQHGATGSAGATYAGSIGRNSLLVRPRRGNKYNILSMTFEPTELFRRKSYPIRLSL